MEIHDCEEIKWTEVENALTDLNLKWVTMGDYIVVMKNKCDVSIGGEPYLVLQLWFNVKSGKIINRIWDQTVSSGKVSGVSQFVEACSSHFKGRPCIGCPVPSNEISWENYLISQTPIPRKISGTQKGLEWHERQHTGDKPFKCPLSDIGFPSSGGLAQHKRGVHKITGPRGSRPGWDAYKKKSKSKSQLLPPK